MNEWISQHGQINEWVNDIMNEQMRLWMTKLDYGWMMSEWVNERVNERKERIIVWVNECLFEKNEWILNE